MIITLKEGKKKKKTLATIRTNQWIAHQNRVQEVKKEKMEKYL